MSLGCECDDGYTSFLCRKKHSDDSLVPWVACIASRNCHMSSSLFGGFCEAGYERDMTNVLDDACVAKGG